MAVPLEWGGYVLALAGPNIKISLDGRFATLYPESIVEGNFALYNGATGWEEYIQKFKPDVILAPNYLPHLEKSDKWTVSYRDKISTVYLATDSLSTDSLSTDSLSTGYVPKKAFSLENSPTMTFSHSHFPLNETGRLVIFSP